MEAEDKFSGVPGDVIRRIALNMSTYDIASTCLTSKAFNHAICDNQAFWREITRMDFPQFELRKPERYTWKYFYMVLTGNTVPEVTIEMNAINLMVFLAFLRNITFHVPVTVSDDYGRDSVVIEDVRFTKAEFDDIVRTLKLKPDFTVYEAEYRRRTELRQRVVFPKNDEEPHTEEFWLETLFKEHPTREIDPRFYTPLFIRHYLIYDKLKPLVDRFFFYPATIHSVGYADTKAYLYNIFNSKEADDLFQRLSSVKHVGEAIPFDRESEEYLMEALYKVFAITARNGVRTNGIAPIERNEVQDKINADKKKQRREFVHTILNSNKFGRMTIIDKKLTLMQIIQSGATKEDIVYWSFLLDPDTLAMLVRDPNWKPVFDAEYKKRLKYTIF